MSRMSKATQIPLRVKNIVMARDGGRCIICGAPGLPNAHYIRRSQGGLGIEENVVTLCPQCHHDFDNGFKRQAIGDYISEYLDRFYPDFPDEKRRYNKYDWLNVIYQEAHKTALNRKTEAHKRAMIENWDFHNLNMDFSSMYEGNDHPSDIDMFYLCRDNTLIVGEIKNARGTFGDGQRRMISRLLNSHKGDAIGLYITHDGFVQKGTTEVDVSRCPVREIYVKGEGEWRLPKHSITVKEVLDYYRRRKR